MLYKYPQYSFYIPPLGGACIKFSVAVCPREYGPVCVVYPSDGSKECSGHADAEVRSSRAVTDSAVRREKLNIEPSAKLSHIFFENPLGLCGIEKRLLVCIAVVAYREARALQSIEVAIVQTILIELETPALRKPRSVDEPVEDHDIGADAKTFLLSKQADCPLRSAVHIMLQQDIDLVFASFSSCNVHGNPGLTLAPVSTWMSTGMT